MDIEEYFGGLSHQWSRYYGARGKFSYRIELFARAVMPLLPLDSWIIDLGCGSGHIACKLATCGYSVTCVDISSEMIEVAKSNCSGLGVDFCVLDGDSAPCFPFGDSCVDGIVASSVLEYVGDVHAEVKELSRILRPGGILVISVPNVSHPLRVVEAAFRVVAGMLVILRADKCVPRRLSAYIWYLRLSKNRLSFRRWERILQGVSLVVVNAVGGRTPLLLVVAKKGECSR